MQRAALKVALLGTLGLGAVVALRLAGPLTVPAVSQDGPGWNDPAVISPQLPPGYRPGPQSPIPPAASPRPAGWPGAPVPFHTAPNGDTVLGSTPAGGRMTSGDLRGASQDPAGFTGGSWRQAGPDPPGSEWATPWHPPTQSTTAVGWASSPSPANSNVGWASSPSVPNGNDGWTGSQSYERANDAQAGSPRHDAQAGSLRYGWGNDGRAESPSYQERPPVVPFVEDTYPPDNSGRSYPVTDRPAPPQVWGQPGPWQMPERDRRDYDAPAERSITGRIASRSVASGSPASSDINLERPRSSMPGSNDAGSSPLHTARLDERRDPPPSDDVPPPYRREEKLAQVGNEVILAADLVTGLYEQRAKAIQEIRAKSGGHLPPGQIEALDEQIKALVQKQLKPKVEAALLCQHAAKTIPPEGLVKIKENIGKEFEKREVPELIKRMGLQSRQELEDRFQSMGMTLEARKRDFIEQVLAQEWLRQQAKPTNEEITRAQLLDYYHAHSVDFDRPARAKWEQLTVRLEKYGSRQEAWNALAEMGNAVIRGARFDEMAKARSDGPTADKGGLRDWTSRGSLNTEILEKAIFGLPVGQLSPILEEEKMLHIVRVIEREDGGHLSFDDAQPEITKNIRKQREMEAKEAFLANIRDEIPVWTAFDMKEKKDSATLPSLFR